MPTARTIPSTPATDSPGSSAATSVLLIEDDHNIQRSVSYQLGRQGYEVTCCDDGEEGLEKALKGRYQVIVLDVMLPKLDGLSVCRRIRALHPEQPILITSARTTDMDKITGLDFGADDYLAKPFSPAELEARIRAVRRRLAGTGSGATSATIVVGDIVLDAGRRSVCVGERSSRLTPKEYDLLSLLMRYPGRIFSRDALLAHVWGFSYQGYNRAVDAHILRVRTKLIEIMPGRPEPLEAIYGVGYRLRDSNPPS